MNRLRNPRNGVVVNVDDDTAKRLTAEGWKSDGGGKKPPTSDVPAAKTTTRKPRK